MKSSASFALMPQRGDCSHVHWHYTRSLRAKYGEDNVKCGVVVPNSAEHAVNAFFGDNQDLIAVSVTRLLIALHLPFSTSHVLM